MKKAVESSKFEILTDDTKLTQILTNLLNNSLKFTPKGFIEFGYTLNGSNINFYVKDTGIGVKPEFQESIFERFRQAETSISRNYGGTGLGLSISKSFAEMLKGNITLQSQPGEGSVFTLSIPYVPVVQELPKKTDFHVEISDEPLLFLVAEDEDFNFKLLEAVLADLNCKLIRAKTGVEAVKICKETDAIDLVLMDIKMPEMDGVAALSEIRKFRYTLPVIAQTAYALEHEKQQFLEMGFNDYISKPIDKKLLWEKIQNLLTNCQSTKNNQG